jgi:toxin-antitoxin system PIN domain toxin
MTYLLDANLLIALTVEEHEHHERASSWASNIDELAICPIVEGALVRFLVRLGESAAAATDVIHRIHEMRSCQFWPDSVSYSDVELSHVVGHRQVTDAYLASLANARNGTLATLDEGLASSLPDRTLLVPPHRIPRDHSEVVANVSLAAAE